jgi:Tfp pilus assembly protein PilZ
MADLSKRSRAARALTDIRVEARCTAGQFRASARDLSATGMRIRGPFHVSLGERIMVTLDLPTPHRLAVMAEVRWVKEDGPENYVLGIRFVHSSETQKKMQLLLQEVQSGKLGVLRSAANTRRVPKV